MLFTSYEFIIFVAVLLFMYYVLPKKFQWIILLLASYTFYFIAKPIYLIYIFVTTVTIYYVAIQIEKNSNNQKAFIKAHKEEMSKAEIKVYKNSQKKIRSRWKVSCIIINVGILAFVKYINFLIDNINGVIGIFATSERLSFMSIAVPLGISFYTFQALGYLIDVSRGTVRAEKNLFKFALFVSFFPQLAQGPISRYGNLSQTIYNEHKFDSKVVSYGLQRILWGFFKKLVIADRILIGVTTILGNSSAYSGGYAFAGMIFYTIQLYADFTGGIDITIGIAEMLGIRVMENFKRPYFSKSLKEYWRRWHISMSNWFRDYIFYPLSSSNAMQKFTKFSRVHLGNNIGKRLPVYISSFVVWFTTGLWHGSSWNFIMWGIANFLILMISEELEPLYDRIRQRFKFTNKLWFRFFQVGRTFLLICILNLFDCYESIADIFKMMISAFTITKWHMLWNGSMLKIGLTGTDYWVLLGGIIVMLIVSLVQRKGSVRDRIASKPYLVRFCLWFGMFIVVLLMGVYGVGYDASQFIYNRF